MKMEIKKTKTGSLTIRLSEPEKTVLRIMANRENCNMSDIVMDALHEYCGRHYQDLYFRGN